RSVQGDAPAERGHHVRLGRLVSAAMALTLSSATSRCVTTLSLLAALLVTPLFAQDRTGQVTREVVGEGATLQEARSNAIRQAMQASISQLVVADRTVSDDQILEDRVISTMKGFVDRVEELDVSKEGSLIRVRSRITVSTTRL